MALKGIKVGNQSLILPPDIKLRFELVNTAFDFENIAAGLVWELELPVEGNAHILNFSHFIETKNKSRIYDASVIIGANEVKGKLVILKTGNIVYECSFVVNGFPVDILEKKLPEIITDSFALMGASWDQDMVNHANSIVNKTYPEVNYNFRPFKNTELYNGNNPTFGGIVNRWNISSQSYDVNDITDSVNYNRHSLCPWLYLSYVIKTVFSALGYSVTGGFFTNTDMQRLMLYNNYCIDKTDDWFKGSFTGNHHVNMNTGENNIVPINDDSTGDNIDPDNLFEVATYEYTIRHEGSYHIFFDISIVYAFGIGTPGIYLDGVAFSGITINSPVPETFVFNSSHVGKKLTIRFYANTDLEYTIEWAVLTIRNGYHPDFNVYQKVINFSNHVPDISVRNFIIALRKMFAIKMDFHPGERSVMLDFNKDIFSKKTDDVTNKAAKNYAIDSNDGFGFTIGFTFDKDSLNEDNFRNLSDMRNIGNCNSYIDLPQPETITDIILVLNTNKWYGVIYNELDQLEWTFICDNYYDRIIGDGKTEIRTEFSPMFMIVENLTGGKGIIPHIEQIGSSPVFFNGKNPFPLKLVYDYGMQDGFGGNYPLASSQNRDYNGDVIGSLTLRHDDDQYGLYITFWKKWLDFLMNTETILRDFQLNVTELFGNLFSRKKKVQHVENIFKKVTAEVSAHSISESEVEQCKIL